MIRKAVEISVKPARTSHYIIQPEIRTSHRQTGKTQIFLL